MTTTPGQGEASSRALVWWQERELGGLRARLEERLARFGREWGLETSLSPLLNACEAALPPAMRDACSWVAMTSGSQGGHGMWVAGLESPVDLLRGALFGESRATARRGGRDDEPLLAGTVAAQAWRALCAALADETVQHVSQDAEPAGVLPSSAFPSGQNLPWSGAIRGVISICGMTSASLAWHLEPARARAWIEPRAAMPAPLQARAALTPVLDAMRRQRVRMTARLTDIELDLGTLLALQPGDVVTVSHALDQPVPLYLNEAGGSSPLAAAHLGAVHEAKAVQFMPHGSPDTGTSQH